MTSSIDIATANADWPNVSHIHDHQGSSYRMSIGQNISDGRSHINNCLLTHC